MNGPITLTEALDWLHTQLETRAPEAVLLPQAAGRVLATALTLAPSPPHPTAAIDGTAVRAAATEGASDYAPLPIAGTSVRAGDAMPSGADAVLPPPAYDAGAVLIPIGRGANVHPPAHDIPTGATVPAGTRLTALHLALLPGDPLVRLQPRVTAPSPTLQALAAAAGAFATADDPDLLLLTKQPATGWTAHATAIAICPGENTCIGHFHQTPAIILPRHPADAATVFAILVAPILRHLAGLPEPQPTAATLTRKIASPLGQLDAVRVRVDSGEATPLGPAAGIGLLAAAGANGLALVPEGSEGYPAGAIIPIYPV
jgi:molybdopterin biosynthesis enzyme